MSNELQAYLDSININGGYGAKSKSIANVLAGHNHRGDGIIAPASRDHQGYTFFTKPNLNLSYGNVNMARRLSFLANQDANSMASAIRCMLSPLVLDNWGAPVNNDTSTQPNAIGLPRSSIVDDRDAFIPLLSNTLTNLSGWPDVVAYVYTTKEGLRKESISFIDSISDIYSIFDLTCVFQNVDGNPILTLIAAWVEYSTRVAEGSLNPYATSIIDNEIDYQTRIYRVTLDPTKQYVRQIAEACVGFPSSVPIGANFNYSNESVLNVDNANISVRFSCTGARYNDPLSIDNFNRVVETFNPSMRKDKRKDMVLLTTAERRIFNFHGYPRISDNYEFQWWVTKETYEELQNHPNTPAPSLTSLNSAYANTLLKK